MIEKPCGFGIGVKSIRWGANVELRGHDSQRLITGDGILYDERTGNVELTEAGCRAVVVPPQGTVIVLEERQQVVENAVNEPTRSPASPEPPPARPIKARR